MNDEISIEGDGLLQGRRFEKDDLWCALGDSPAAAFRSVKSATATFTPKRVSPRTNKAKLLPQRVWPITTSSPACSRAHKVELIAAMPDAAASAASAFSKPAMHSSTRACVGLRVRPYTHPSRSTRKIALRPLPSRRHMSTPRRRAASMRPSDRRDCGRCGWS